MLKSIKKALRVLLAAGIAAGSLGAAPLAAGDTVTLVGAGATFPYPIYSKWFDEFHKKNPDVEINYQSIGSGGGIRQVTAKTVDFGATDGPMTNDQLFAVDGKILHLPTVMGAVVVVYNLPSFNGKIQITGSVLADIFLGKIKSWDDPALASLNKGLSLPSVPIVVIHRSDGSGTSYCFTDYLSKVSDAWKSKVGKGTAVNWPAGLGGKGNEGVSGTVKQTAGGIGYVELIYAVQNKIPFMAVKNKSGRFVEASVEGVTAAAKGAEIPADFRVSITDAEGEDAYPISTFTWLLVYERTGGRKGEILHDFLLWMLNDGEKIAPSLGYAPLPDAVAAKVKEAAEKVR
jgi:phosphate transport system substrate-binding protein